MIAPSIDDLLEIVDSKYTLVTLAAKRARAITEGATPLIPVEWKDEKPATIALEEIKAGKIKYVRVDEGIK